MPHEIERCFCGNQSLTVSGYCSEHIDRETARFPTLDPTAAMESLQRRLSDTERRLREATEELDTHRKRARELHKILMLVSMGDIKVDEIGDILGTRAKEQAR